MTTTTTAALNSGSGSLTGIAAQVSLPSMSTSRLLRVIRLVGARDRLVDDVLEQVGLHRAIGRRRHGFARLCQRGIAALVERRPGAAHLIEPPFEILGRHRLG